MDTRPLVNRTTSDVEDWSEEFSLRPLPMYPSLSHLEVDLAVVDEKDGDDEHDDGNDEEEDEDWDMELIGTAADDAQREESNSFFRALLATTDGPDACGVGGGDTGAGVGRAYTLPDTYKLIENAKHCFEATHRRPSSGVVYPPATTLLTLELDGFPLYANKQLEEWLQHIVQPKEQAAMGLEKQWSHHVCPDDVLSGLAPDTLHRFSQLLVYFVRRSHVPEAKLLLQAFANQLDEPRWYQLQDTSAVHGKPTEDDEWHNLWGGWSVEIAQVAIEICHPPQGESLFANVVSKCHQLFPAWRQAMTLVECRYVSHHWAYFQSHQYVWQRPLEVVVEPVVFATPFPSGQDLLRRYLALYTALNDDDVKQHAGNLSGADMGLLSTSTRATSVQVLVLCDVQNLVDRLSPITDENIPPIFHDDQMSSRHSHDSEPQDALDELFHPDNCMLRMESLEASYVKLAMPHDVLVKAKCAHVLSRMMLGHTEMWPLCESLAMEALRLLDIGFPLSFPKGESQRQGLFGHVGRHVLETLVGAVLAHNNKYRFAIASYEAAQQLYSFQYLNRRGYEKLDRVCCGLCLHQGDLDRALQYHDRVLQWTKEHENCNEFVYITQMINSILLQQSQFRLAAHRLRDALMALRDPLAVLPPAYTKSAAPARRLFHYKFHANGYDAWFLHDIQLHLCLRDVYKASGRGQEALHVLQHVLSYEPKFKLPRGRRIHLTMLVAEDALKLRQLELCISMLRTIEHDIAMDNNNTATTTVLESKHAWEVMATFRYLKCRARCYFYKGQYHRCALWLAVAASKGLSVRQRADVDALGSRCLLQLHHKQLQDGEFAPLQRTMSGRWGFTAQEPSLGLLLSTKSEQDSFHSAMDDHWNIRSYTDACTLLCWKAFDLYGTLNDPVRQAKVVLTLVRLDMLALEKHTSDVSSLHQATALARQALDLAAESAVPMKVLTALVYTAQLQCWWTKCNPDHDTHELVATTDEALRLLFAIFLRQVRGSQDSIHVVPLLPFPPSVLMQLEAVVGTLLHVGATITQLDGVDVHALFSWRDLESAYHCLNKCTYWYSAQPETPASDDSNPQPVAARPVHVRVGRQPQHQKQLSLSSISDIVSFSFFRRPDSFTCADHGTPLPLSPFAYVGPIKSRGVSSAAAGDARSRSQSAPATNDADPSTAPNPDDDGELEVEPDGVDFWRACNQEYRKQHMVQWSSNMYAADSDALWGIWYCHRVTDRKFKSGRVTPSAFRLASLKLIFDIRLLSHSTALHPLPTTLGTTDSFGVVLHERDCISVVKHSTTTHTSSPVDVFTFPASNALSLHQGIAGVPFQNQAVTSAQVERVLLYLGPKVLMKVLSSMLLEIPLIVVHSSTSVVQEVLFVLTHLMHPFRWSFPMLPALPMSCTSMFADLIQDYTKAKQKHRPMAPFVAGISMDMWRECTYRLSTVQSSSDCATCISVLQVNLSSKCKFQLASNRSSAVYMQPRLRRYVVDAVTTTTGGPASAALEAALQEVYRVILQSFQKAPSFKQWFRLESQEFTKLFQATATCQAYLNGGDGRLSSTVV
ncbi:hypothetical protein DYB30_000936 [Aphanomyces astaci]|uniref:cDENN domain-containing protein n=1 Tax=Aphanomyces astaci TaxID=112090 RepID=A0A397EBZ3_APHAT|nr:hypothetical protein DYB30_000936 [Aphanomyces astaci]